MRSVSRRAATLGLVLAAQIVGHLACAADAPLRVGSKRFTESYILGEIIAHVARERGVETEHRLGLGSTGIVYAALKAGQIDVYPEYTGTIAREILRLDRPTMEDMARRLADDGLAIGVPLGFNNTYALAMRADLAERLNIRTLSDLGRNARLRLGLSPEFLGRSDGWTGLRLAYNLPFPTPPGIEHGLAYEAVEAGRIDVIDVYSTDAKIERYNLRVLEDDRNYFPKYDAVLLYRQELPVRFPGAWPALRDLAGRIDADTMVRLNASVEIDRLSFAQAADLFFDPKSGVKDTAKRRASVWSMLAGADFWRLTREHIALTFGSLAIAIAAGVPLGVVAAKVPRLASIVIALVGMLQTVPSLAMLAFLIAIVGTIGFVPALIALFLYALLPLVRNTHAALTELRPGIRQAGLALGLSGWQRLRAIELPLAWPTILAGIKTSAVINVGTATIAAFIGAGGYGERIAQGLALNDTSLLLAGAIPAAVLALVTQWAFDAYERHGSWMARAARSPA